MQALKREQNQHLKGKPGQIMLCHVCAGRVSRRCRR